MLFIIPAALAVFCPLTWFLLREIIWPDLPLALGAGHYFVKTITATVTSLTPVTVTITPATTTHTPAPITRWQPAVTDTCVNVFSPEYIFSHGLTPEKTASDWELLITVYKNILEKYPNLALVLVLSVSAIFLFLLGLVLFSRQKRGADTTVKRNEQDPVILSLMSGQTLQLPVTTVTSTTHNQRSTYLRSRLRAESQSAVSDLRNKSHDLQNELRAAVKRADLDKNQSQKQVSKHTSKIHELEQQLQHEELLFDKMKFDTGAQKLEQQKVITGLKARNLKIEKEIEELKVAARAKLQQQDAKMTTTVTAINEQNTRMKQQIVATGAENSQLKKRVESLEQKIRDTNVDELQKTMHLQIQNADVERQQLQRTIATVKYEKYEMEQKIARLESELAKNRMSDTKPESTESTNEALLTQSVETTETEPEREHEPAPVVSVPVAAAAVAVAPPNEENGLSSSRWASQAASKTAAAPPQAKNELANSRWATPARPSAAVAAPTSEPPPPAATPAATTAATPQTSSSSSSAASADTAATTPSPSTNTLLTSRWATSSTATTTADTSSTPTRMNDGSQAYIPPHSFSPSEASYRRSNKFNNRGGNNNKKKQKSTNGDLQASKWAKR